MLAFYADHFEVQLPPGHRFPMSKYALLRKELIHHKILRPDQLHPSAHASTRDLLRVHTEDYVYRFLQGKLTPKEEKTLGLPWSQNLVDRSLGSVYGTLSAAHFALSYGGIGGNLAGGTHHAFAGHGEGFCVFNDLAVASAVLLDEQESIQKILILDLDVHQGNGTASIFAQEPHVFTCSIHGENNYPFHRPPSDLDINLPDHTDDKTYLQILRTNLSRILIEFQPDFIFYQAGVDVLQSDRLGRLSLTHQGAMERDHLVLKTAHQHDIPIALTLGGGYGVPIETSIKAHLNTYRVATSIF